MLASSASKAWPRVAMADVVVETQYGTSQRANENGVGVPVLRMNNLTPDGQIDLSSLKHVSLATSDLDRYTVRAGDILFNRTNSPDLVGKMALWDRPEPLAFAGYLVRVRVDESRVDPRFVTRWFNTPEMKAQLRIRAKPSINMSNISASELLKFRLPLPTLAEQRRVSEILARADALRAKRREASQVLQELIRSLFMECFGPLRSPPVTIGDVTEHKNGWRWEMLTDVARLATGHTPDRKVPAYWNGGIPWISLSDIRTLDGTVGSSTSETISENGIAHSAAVKLPPGTVCFSRTASIGFVTVMGREMATSQDFVNWVCGPSLDPTYLMHALILSRSRLRALAPGSTHKTIYFPTVQQFRVLVPPLDQQRMFAKQAETLASIRMGQAKSTVALDELFASLQQRSFEGGL